MARRTTAQGEAPAADEATELVAADSPAGVPDEAAETATSDAEASEEVVEAESASEVDAPQGEFDLEQWVADVYAYHYNDGPKPVRKYLPAPQLKQ